MFSKIKNYIVQSVGELKKVTWPKKSEVIRLTVIVIISTGVAVLIVAGLDWILTKLVNYFVMK